MLQYGVEVSRGHWDAQVYADQAPADPVSHPIFNYLCIQGHCQEDLIFVFIGE